MDLKPQAWETGRKGNASVNVVSDWTPINICW